MKTAVVFYSLDGNCAFVAEEIKSHLNADLIRLHTKNEKKRSFIGNLFWGCCMVFFRKKPPLKPYTFNASKYDFIIMGAPVWADSPAPPIKTFLSEAGIINKKIGLFVCHAGGKGNSMEKFKRLLTGNTIITETEFKDPVKGDKEEVKKQIENWVRGLKG